MKFVTDKLKQTFSYKKLSDNDTLKVGTLVKGYTYSIGDYHNDLSRTPKKYLGNPKLRTGIVVEAFSNNIFKVQFWNTAALEEFNKKITNKIHYKFTNLNLKTNFEICGTDTYCQFVQRKQILFVSSNKTTITDNLQKLQENIFSKHSKEKRAVAQYIGLGKYKGLSQDKMDQIFEKWQFTKREKYMSHEKAWEKVSLLHKRHEANNCIDNEYKKIKNVRIFLDYKKMDVSEKRLYEEFLNSSFNEYQCLETISNLKKNEINLKEPEISDSNNELELEM